MFNLSPLLYWRTRMKSDTCFSKRTNQPLSVYYCEEEAYSAASYERLTRGISLYPYLCNKCQLYHLAPEESRLNVKHNACFCRDSNGKPKAWYLTKEDAEKQREKSEHEQHIRLKIYECEQHLGFHLTHML